MDAKSLSFELDSQTEVLRADYYRKDFCKKKEKSHFYALNECIHFAHAGISVEFVPHMVGQEPANLVMEDFEREMQLKYVFYGRV